VKSQISDTIFSMNPPDLPNATVIVQELEINNMRAHFANSFSTTQRKKSEPNSGGNAQTHFNHKPRQQNSNYNNQRNSNNLSFNHDNNQNKNTYGCYNQNKNNSWNQGRSLWTAVHVVARRARERAKTTTIYSRRIENLPLWSDRNE